MKVVYTLVKIHPLYFKMLCTYKYKKKAEEALEKIVNETRQLGFHVIKNCSHYVVTNAHSVYDHELYIQPTDYIKDK